VVYVNEWAGDPVARLLDRIGEEVARAVGQRATAVDGPSGRLAASLAAWTARWNLDLLVILDQFEEYFLYHPDEDGPGTFAVEFPRAVNRSELPVSFLVAIREDALAKLDRFKGSIANLFENYVRIRHLHASQAEAAVLGPLSRLSERAPAEEPWTADPELVRAVLDGVQVGKVVHAAVGRGVAAETADRQAPDPPIETPYLQMVLTRLWAEEAATGSRRLRLATLEALGGPQRIVRGHLDEALERLSAEQREVAARVFHHLVTPTGSKIAHTATDLADYTGLPGDQVRSVLDRLSAPDARILRTVAPPSGQEGESRYEIFHDVLAPAILGWRARWEARRQADAAARRRFEERARRWRRLARVWAGLLVAMLVVSLAALAVQSRRAEGAARAELAAIRAQQAAYVAQADTICVRGWARGREEAGRKPSLNQRLELADWLMTKVSIGRETSRRWRRLPPPPGSQAQTRTVLQLYDHGLNAYGDAALDLVLGKTDDAMRRLREGEQIGVAYRQVATRQGYRQCQGALPL
jgi:hypothetical protein